MRIVRKSSDRLTVRFVRRLRLGVCALDRTKNTATVTMMVLAVPWRRKLLPLSEVRNVFVERSSGSRIYRTILETRGGKISVGNCSKAEALEIAQAIRDFLQQQTKPLLPADSDAAAA